MNEVYNGGFAPEFSVSMLKETIALVRDYVSETFSLPFPCPSYLDSLLTLPSLAGRLRWL